jgi:hypothetical protein
MILIISERRAGRALPFPLMSRTGVAAGETDPITAGLRGVIKVRGDMRYLMENADAVKLMIQGSLSVGPSVLREASTMRLNLASAVCPRRVCRP